MKDFFVWLETFLHDLPSQSLETLIAQEGGVAKTAVIGVDLIEGFCHQGPLQSPDIGALVEPSVGFLQKAHELGVEHFFFPCDAHREDCPEFQSFPPHCLEGSQESQLVESIKGLEFSSKFQRLNKRSVSSMFGTKLPEKLREIDVDTIICIGDCTDLCLYHLAVGLRFFANQEGLPWQVWVPKNLVATYDLPVEVANEIGAMPHPGPLMHDMFLYHLALNGVKLFQWEE